MSVNSELELEIGNDFDNNMEKSENLDVPKTDVIKEIMSGSTRSGSSKKTSEKTERTEKVEKPERKVSNRKSASRKQVSNRKSRKSSDKKSRRDKPVVKKTIKKSYLLSIMS